MSSYNLEDEDSKRLNIYTYIFKFTLMPDFISLGIILFSSLLNSFTLTVIIPTVSLYSAQLDVDQNYAGLVVGIYSIA
eukprot:Pgem_evm1s16331